jgi:septal ring factor EnvC (AmiA/AmiB activator)
MNWIKDTLSHLLKKAQDNYCKLILITIQVLFLGGGHVYLKEFNEIRKQVVTTGEKVQKSVEQLNKTGKNIEKAGQNVNNSIKSIEKELKKVKKACSKFL